MAIKTFISGEVLTAADTNTYLANSGLVFVKETALATTTDITSCFSATYTSYEIVCNVTSTGSGGAASITSQLLSGTTPLAGTGYSYTLAQQGYAAAAFVTASAAGVAFWAIGRADAATTNSIFVATIVNPFVSTEPTQFTAKWVDDTTTGTTGGKNTSVASYDGLRLTGMTNPVGTVTVYGYRKA
jgi:hypothetical protein